MTVHRNHKILFAVLFILMTSTVLLFNYSNTQQNLFQSNASSSAASPLPGEVYWSNNESSYLFGTNYATTSGLTENDISLTQSTLATSQMTLLRTPFPDTNTSTNRPTTEREIAEIISESQNTHMACLGVITNTNNITFASNLVSTLGNKCLLYEFGNEPDKSMSASTYTHEWNSQIPLLRARNPNAKFIAPVLSTYNPGWIEAFLIGVKASNIIPDAISFHDYACTAADTESTCLAKATTIGMHVQTVRLLVKNTLHLNLPIGVSAWGAFAQGSTQDQKPSYTSNSAFTYTFTKQSMLSLITQHTDFANYTELPVTTGSHSTTQAYKAIEDVINTYNPADIACPRPVLSVVPVCTGDKNKTPALTISWNNIHNQIHNTYLLQYSYSIDGQQASPPSFSQTISNPQQMNGSSFIQYEINKPPNTAISARIAYINGVCAKNPNYSYSIIGNTEQQIPQCSEVK